MAIESWKTPKCSKNDNYNDKENVKSTVRPTKTTSTMQAMTYTLMVPNAGIQSAKMKERGMFPVGRQKNIR